MDIVDSLTPTKYQVQQYLQIFCAFRLKPAPGVPESK